MKAIFLYTLDWFFNVHRLCVFLSASLPSSIFSSPIKNLCSRQLFLYVWWEAPPLTKVVLKCSTVECGVQCAMTPGTSMMQMYVREGLGRKTESRIMIADCY